jgi:hypothetical protein
MLNGVAQYRRALAAVGVFGTESFKRYKSFALLDGERQLLFDLSLKRFEDLSRFDHLWVYQTDEREYRVEVNKMQELIARGDEAKHSIESRLIAVTNELAQQAGTSDRNKEREFRKLAETLLARGLESFSNSSP